MNQCHYSMAHYQVSCSPFLPGRLAPLPTQSVPSTSLLLSLTGCLAAFQFPHYHVATVALAKPCLFFPLSSLSIVAL